METWFSTPERIASLQMACQSWLGTPFVPNACVRGQGVSCQKLAGGLYRDAGHGYRFEIPDADMRWSQAHSGDESLIVKFFYQPEVSLVFTELAGAIGSQFKTGDVIGFTLGKCIHHIGIVSDESKRQFIHCMRGCGTVYARYDDATYMKRIGKVWRPIP